MNIDGRAIAADILGKVRADLALLPKPPVVRAIVMQPSAATESYLKVKSSRARDAGMELEVIAIPEDHVTTDVLAAMNERGADAMLVQLPLPSHIDTQSILDAIALEQDADVLSTLAHALFESGNEQALLPPVVDAVKEILMRSNIEPKGKRVTVVGKGWLVGEPCAAWLRNQGSEVTVVTRETETAEFVSALKNAEIIISGAGVAGLIKPEHLSEGVVLIDAGTSESGGSIAGDADPSCADIASVFTPVPGGVGPLAVACLFRNVSILVQRRGLRSL
ncbi:MAG: bifunctional methylenetetrahydrofolate dehydrogenase/methenyltetrahydrofolate cyclohydrolase [Parcubacteria group bacterium]|nr:bifunctional methylenetetrahydrofolate dehydrogenase/methenyltetrahydrofolate cyclohydrolase [Parcubacteria group bacterium]